MKYGLQPEDFISSPNISPDQKLDQCLNSQNRLSVMPVSFLAFRVIHIGKGQKKLNISRVDCGRRRRCNRDEGSLLMEGLDRNGEDMMTWYSVGEGQIGEGREKGF